MVFTFIEFYMWSLLTILPCSFIHQRVPAIELTVPVSNILEELTFVIVTIFPNINTVAGLTVQKIVPSVGLTVLLMTFFPNTESISDTLLKITFVIATITPNIFPIALGQSIDVLPFI